MKEYNLVATNAVDSSHQSPKEVVALEALLEAMWTVCCVHAEDFQNLQKTHELQGGEDLGKSVDWILCDSPYSVHR